MPLRPKRSRVRASAAKSFPVMFRTVSISASIAGVLTPAALPKALIGIRPVGTSSVMNLWSSDFGVPVA
jgi:hypothetical protein